MSENDTLSDQVQVLLKELEGHNESRWQRDMKFIIEESVSRILEEVLTRKLQEVGLVASKNTIRRHHDGGETRPHMGIVRSWAAGQVARSQTFSSIGASTNPAVVGTERVRRSLRKSELAPSRTPQKQKCEVECALPSCTPTQDNHVHFDASQELPDKELPSICRNDPAIMISQASDAQAPAPQENPASSSASAQIAKAGLPDSEQQKSMNMKSPKSSNAGQVQSFTGNIPTAWDPDNSGRADRYARSSELSQGFFSSFVDPKQRLVRFLEQLTQNAMVSSPSRRLEHSSLFQKMCATIVLNKRFDFIMSIVILANAATMGVSADRQAKDVVEVEPVFIVVTEAVFFCLFAGELMLRLNVYRWEFVSGPGRGWNIFESVLVTAQLLEEVLYFLSSGSQTMRFVGALRMFRLVRVVRLARILCLMKELHILVSSISNSIRALAWTLVLMFMMVYSMSLCITQLVTSKRISAKVAGDGELDELTLYFGSVPRAMLSLFEAITGGVDWDVIVMPLLQDVHPLLGLVFVAYVAVAILGLMNVVTGVFVDSVLASARIDKEQFLLNNAKELFATAEEEMDWEAFNGKMGTPQMLDFFKGIDVDPSEAKDIFALIDWDQSGSINVEEFLNGCIRLHGPSKALGSAALHQELRILRKDLRSRHAENRMLRARSAPPS